MTTVLKEDCLKQNDFWNIFKQTNKTVQNNELHVREMTDQNRNSLEY